MPVDEFVIVPLVMDHEKVALRFAGTEATLPVELAQTGDGAKITGAGSQTWTSSCVVPR